ITVYPTPPPPGLSQRGDTLFASGIYATYQWYYDSTAISGATDSFYVATQSGNYNIIVTDVNGCDVGAGIINVVAGIAAAGSSSMQVEVFPVPAKDELIVNWKSLTGKETTLKVFDVFAREVYSTQMTTPIVKLQTSGWSAGIYLLKIADGERQII